MLTSESLIKYSGGAYGKLDRMVVRERHHMPADSVTSLPRSKGPSIQMDASDHANTSNYDSSAKAKFYREKIRDMVDQDKMRDAMATEIKDVRSISGAKYNSAILEMLEYTKKRNILKDK